MEQGSVKRRSGGDLYHRIKLAETAACRIDVLQT